MVQSEKDPEIGMQKFEASYAQLASAISMQLTGCIA